MFEEQLGILKTATDGTYNYHAVSASDNPRIISGEQAHGGVALLWKYSINDFVTPIKSIQSDRIVGIKCEFSGCRPLFILGVYLPSSNHTLDEFQECLDLLWALYESLSADGFVIVLGDVNGDFGNCLGVRGKKEPNVRGKLLIDFANFFNVCPVNLLSSCSGPLETYISHCGRFRSTIDYILLPNYLRNKIIMSKTFDFDADNTSDHQPIILKLDYITQLSNDQPVVIPVRKQKVHWSKFSQEAINSNYVDPLLFDLSTLVWPETSDLNELVEFVCDLLLKNSLPLAAPVLLAIKSTNLAFMLVYLMMSRRLVHHAKMPLRPGNRLIFLLNLTNTTHTRLNARIIACPCAVFYISLNQTELQSSAVRLTLMRSYFGNFSRGRNRPPK